MRRTESPVFSVQELLCGVGSGPLNLYHGTGVQPLSIEYIEAKCARNARTLCGFHRDRSKQVAGLTEQVSCVLTF